MRALKIFLPAFLALTLSGCASYHLGPVMDKDDNRTVQVLPLNNQTLQPRLGDTFTQALRERLQADATYRLDTAGNGDIVITGVIREYKRAGMGYSSRDSVTAENYRVQAIVHVVARERSTGKLLLERDVNARTLVHVGNDLASSERQALPLLAEDFARNLTELLTEGAW